MNAFMDLARRARDAASEAVLAGVIVGAGEALQIVLNAGAGSWPIVAAVGSVGAIVVALVMRALIAGAARVPGIGAWGEAAAAGSAKAIWRGALAFL